MNEIIRKPSAWVPIALSLVVLVMWIIFLAMSGTPPVHQSDEGVGAHLFQIWLLLEMLMILFFAIKWLPQKPKSATLILVIQIILALLACFPVFYFHL